jgi:pimeloyl-ACP methyl ester carboxylesterase
MAFARFDPHRILVPTPLGDVAAIDTGTGDVALFVHGVGTNAHLWAGVLDALAGERRCVAIELPGHGHSPVTDQQDLTIGGLADLVEAFCLTHALERVDLVAHDTGGAVAQVFAARHPERLRSFVLTNCDCHDNIPPDGFLPTVELARAGMLAPGAPDLLADPIAARDAVFAMGYEDVTVLDAARTLDYLGTALGTPERALAFERMLAGLVPDDVLAAEPALATLDVPTLIVWGTGDEFFELSWAYWLRDAIGGAHEVVEIAGAKLFWPDERPGDLVPHLRRHWSSVAAPAAHASRHHPAQPL